MIYVASSWRNERQPEVVTRLREEGFEVYDFRNPHEGDGVFHWSEIDPNWQRWTPAEYRAALTHPLAEQGFESDMNALRRADACVYVLPCGRSASLEAGWASGAGKLTIALLADAEPELMVKLFDHVCLDLEEVVDVLRSQKAPKPNASKCVELPLVSILDEAGIEELRRIRRREALSYMAMRNRLIR